MAIVAVRKKPALPKLEKQKSVFAKKVLSIKDENILELLLSYYQDLTSSKRVTRAQYNKEIEASEKRVKGGKFVTNKQVMNEMKSW